MKDTLFGDLSVIGMRGCEDFAAEVDAYLQLIENQTLQQSNRHKQQRIS